MVCSKKQYGFLSFTPAALDLLVGLSVIRAPPIRVARENRGQSSRQSTFPRIVATASDNMRPALTFGPPLEAPFRQQKPNSRFLIKFPIHLIDFTA